MARLLQQVERVTAIADGGDEEALDLQSFANRLPDRLVVFDQQQRDLHGPIVFALRAAVIQVFRRIRGPSRCRWRTEIGLPVAVRVERMQGHRLAGRNPITRRRWASICSQPSSRRAPRMRVTVTRVVLRAAAMSWWVSLMLSRRPWSQGWP